MNRTVTQTGKGLVIHSRILATTPLHRPSEGATSSSFAAVTVAEASSVLVNNPLRFHLERMPFLSLLGESSGALLPMSGVQTRHLYAHLWLSDASA